MKEFKYLNKDEVSTSKLEKLLKEAERNLVGFRSDYAKSIKDMAKKLQEYAAQETIPDYRAGDIESDLCWVQSSKNQITRIQAQIVAIKECIDLIK